MGALEQIMKLIRDPWENANVSPIEMWLSWFLAPLFTKLNPVMWFSFFRGLAAWKWVELIVLIILLFGAYYLIPLEWVVLYLFHMVVMTVRAFIYLPRYKTHWGFGAAAIGLWIIGIFFVMPNIAVPYFNGFPFYIDMSWTYLGHKVGLI